MKFLQIKEMLIIRNKKIESLNFRLKKLRNHLLLRFLIPK